MKAHFFYHVVFLFHVFLTVFQIFAGFPAGTPVLTARGFIPINKIAVGDRVQGYNASEGSFSPTRVEKIKSSVTQELLVVKTSQGSLYTSPDQLIYEKTSDNFVQADQLKPGNILVTAYGSNCYCDEISRKKLTTVLYELTLEEPHLFFAGNLAVLVHNSFAAAAPTVIPFLEPICKGVLAYLIVQSYLLCKFVEEKYKTLKEANNTAAEKIKEFTSQYFDPGKTPTNVGPWRTAPLVHGIRFDMHLYNAIIQRPWLYGPMFIVANRICEGFVQCVAYVLKFEKWYKGEQHFTWIKLGENGLPINDPFVKPFIDNEIGVQLDKLRQLTPLFPQSFYAALHNSFSSIIEKDKQLGLHYSCFEKVIDDVRYGVIAVYDMIQKNISPVLANNALYCGKQIPVKCPQAHICFEPDSNIAVLVHKQTGKVLRVGFRDEIQKLEDTVSKEQKTPKKTVQDILKGAKPGEKKAKATQWEKTGGYKEAMEDFENLELEDVKNLPKDKVGKWGTLSDGRRAVVRNDSTFGHRPTLEIYNPKNRKSIKIRYL